MMQSLAIILICIIVKWNYCAGASDRNALTSTLSMSLGEHAYLMPAHQHRPAVDNKSNDSFRKVNHRRRHQHYGTESSAQKPSQANNRSNETTITKRRANKYETVINDNNVDNAMTIANTRNKRDTTRQDLCKTLCTCKNDMNFLTIECYFEQVS